MAPTFQATLKPVCVAVLQPDKLEREREREREREKREKEKEREDSTNRCN